MILNVKFDGRSPATEAGLKLEVDHVIPWDKGGETVLRKSCKPYVQIAIDGKSNLDFKIKNNR